MFWRGKLSARGRWLPAGGVDGEAGLGLGFRLPASGFGTNCSYVPTGTFQNGENLRRKVLILRVRFWTDQWNQGVRLWKKCLLSRTPDAYYSGLDSRVMYFIRYAGGAPPDSRFLTGLSALFGTTRLRRDYGVDCAHKIELDHTENFGSPSRICIWSFGASPLAQRPVRNLTR